MFFKKISINGTEYPIAVNITGSGVPGVSTMASVGMLYMDENTGDLYKCIGNDGVGCQWGPLITVDTEVRAGSGNPVSSDAVASALFQLRTEMGDIETVLDNIITLQNSYIGGE